MRVQQLLAWCSIGILPLACGGCSSSSTTAAGGSSGTSGGAAATGGTASGSGGAQSSGGSSTVGGAPSASGGAATGGAAAASGGTAAGGTTGASGGAAAGGASAGGTSAGVAGSAGSSGRAGSSGAGGGSAGVGGGSAGAGGGTSSASPNMNFFVTSDKSTTGNLGGLAGADMRCQRLATAAGFGAKTWRAYLSTEMPAVNARDRIGEGPYYNSKGVMLAATKDALHAIHGDHTLFIDEHGAEINGQWNGATVGSPTNPLEHDVLTGSTNLGMISVGNTCTNWTAISGSSFVGHTDGLGPNMAATGNFVFWAGSHAGQCADTAPAGGAGRLYCFVGP